MKQPLPSLKDLQVMLEMALEQLQMKAPNFGNCARISEKVARECRKHQLIQEHGHAPHRDRTKG